MVGILVQSFFRFPGLPSFPVSNPARPLAVLEGLWHSDQNAMLLALLAVGLFELTIGRQVSEYLVGVVDDGLASPKGIYGISRSATVYVHKSVETVMVKARRISINTQEWTNVG